MNKGPIDTDIRNLNLVNPAGSVLYNNGYLLYPSCADDLGLIHHTADHSLGFVAFEGTKRINSKVFGHTKNYNAERKLCKELILIYSW